MFNNLRLLSPLTQLYLAIHIQSIEVIGFMSLTSIFWCGCGNVCNSTDTILTVLLYHACAFTRNAQYYVRTHMHSYLKSELTAAHHYYIQTSISINMSSACVYVTRTVLIHTKEQISKDIYNRLASLL